MHATCIEGLKGLLTCAANVPQVVAEKGSDAWWQMELKDLLPPSLQGEADTFKKGEDTMVCPGAILGYRV